MVAIVRVPQKNGGIAVVLTTYVPAAYVQLPSLGSVPRSYGLGTALIVYLLGWFDLSTGPALARNQYGEERIVRPIESWSQTASNDAPAQPYRPADRHVK